MNHSVKPPKKKAFIMKYITAILICAEYITIDANGWPWRNKYAPTLAPTERTIVAPPVLAYSIPSTELPLTSGLATSGKLLSYAGMDPFSPVDSPAGSPIIISNAPPVPATISYPIESPLAIDSSLTMTSKPAPLLVVDPFLDSPDGSPMHSPVDLRVPATVAIGPALYVRPSSTATSPPSITENNNGSNRFHDPCSRSISGSIRSHYVA